MRVGSRIVCVRYPAIACVAGGARSAVASAEVERVDERRVRAGCFVRGGASRGVRGVWHSCKLYCCSMTSGTRQHKVPLATRYPSATATSGGAARLVLRCRAACVRTGLSRWYIISMPPRGWTIPHGNSQSRLARLRIEKRHDVVRPGGILGFLVLPDLHAGALAL